MVADSFFIINFSFSLASSIIGLVLGVITICIIFGVRQCRTVPNLLTANTTLIVFIYLVFSLVASIYGMREDWAVNQPACQLRAYAFTASCTLLLYSHLIHAISRLFFVVFYNKKQLLSWRTHWILICINWSLGISLPAVLLFIDGAYIYEEESRLCTCTTKNVLTATYGTVTAFVIPFSSTATIYISLVIRSHRSTRRIRANHQNTDMTNGNRNANMPNMGREMTLIRNMSILLSIISGGGIPYLFVVLWHAIKKSQLPSPFYLLIINSITICTGLMMIALFSLNKQVKTNTGECFQKLCRNILRKLF